MAGGRQPQAGIRQRDLWPDAGAGDVPLRLVYARVAVELDQPQRAIDTLTPLPSVPVERDEALIARATAWRRMGRIEQAMTDINAALKDMPRNGAALLERGILPARGTDGAGARRLAGRGDAIPGFG